jgi:hypothetical protein
MDQARTDSADGSGPMPRAPSPSSWDEWESYYAKASRRRRAMGGGRHLRDAKRKRRVRELFGLGLSGLLVAGMTLVFYLVLR